MQEEVAGKDGTAGSTAYLFDYNNVSVALDVSGSDLSEVLSLARSFRQNGVSTVVDEGSSCISACAFVLSGVAFLGRRALRQFH